PPDTEPDTAGTAALLEALLLTLGPPAVVAGHSYGGVVALTLALRGRMAISALALFEPGAVPILLMTRDAGTFPPAQAMFDDYSARVEAGEADAMRTMVDFWFGAGAFARMPAPLVAFMRQAQLTNTRDIRGAFRPRYTPEALARLTMPPVTVVGGRSPVI